MARFCRIWGRATIRFLCLGQRDGLSSRHCAPTDPREAIQLEPKNAGNHQSRKEEMDKETALAADAALEAPERFAELLRPGPTGSIRFRMIFQLVWRKDIHELVPMFG